MTRVFVSGCYDLLHAGHLQFFDEARALGDHLTVCFADEKILWQHKNRMPSLPDEHKRALIEALPMVDQVVTGDGTTTGLDFEPIFRELKPDLLVVTEDDQYADLKVALCEEIGSKYVRLPKTPPRFEPISTSSILERLQAPSEVPLRVDFAGGWLDVPKHAREGGFIVNCAITPGVSLTNWPYEQKAGLGGSGAWALLNGSDPVKAELDLGVGWQDPAVIRESGLCVWQSGARPRLDLKRDPSFLKGRMALLWTGRQHDTPGSVDFERDYDLIEKAGAHARAGVIEKSLTKIAEAIAFSYQVQLDEKMEPLKEIPGCIARKYSGGGHGGYALYLFEKEEERAAALAADSDMRPIEPHDQWAE
ncbi:adenylyltransferase/cytidyltransferase family protein [Akkermansiaceae bacterium]|nr:adenylyltransferase/cytidyltransferase family protein [Akkermansiaceae bacterium]MDB4290503.1 adenylyltransferase/cytidyltransferase family protein [bacterium]MDB4258566.1 adenylyltransferase/cytidyltransferase family protein [Akkermansiaceae bacterium]MDB4282789.1 adenylyltransferase/cytidyltransferase family protein [Akkermansiaceae bacterium]MDB4297851.1 adenylyltransferase/cytidyltransferase family protein [bacterium]